MIPCPTQVGSVLKSIPKSPFMIFPLDRNSGWIWSINLCYKSNPFNLVLPWGDRREIEKLANGSFIVTTNKGTKHSAPIIAIAGGLGTFEPRKPDLAQLAKWEQKGVDYIIHDPEKYRNKKILIAGGGDSALDWTIVLANVAKSITLVHRRSEFRGSLDSVEKVQALKNQKKVQIVTPAEVTALGGSICPSNC